MLVTLLNIAGVILVFLAVLAFVGVFLTSASAITMLVVGVICLIVAYMLSHRSIV